MDFQPTNMAQIVTWITSAQFAAFRKENTDAHRVAWSADGWIERLGDDALVCFKNDAARDAFTIALAGESSNADLIPRRVFGKHLPKQNADRIAPTLLTGDSSLPPTAVATEGGVKYALDFAAGYSHGLFLDQRANRAFVRRIGPKRLLNTFAYTCSFSVTAALSGAETLNVDLSKKSLDRGRENFLLNGLEPATGHRFIADDVLEVLPRLARRGEKFDCIILDPPTFSRGNQGRRWQVEDHFEDLLNVALELATPGARLLLSTNCTKLDLRTLERMARFCCKTARRGATFHREPALPDFPPGHGATTIWLTAR